MAKAKAKRAKSAGVASQVLDAVASLLPRKKTTKRRENKNGAKRVSAKTRSAAVRGTARKASKSASTAKTSTSKARSTSAKASRSSKTRRASAPSKSTRSAKATKSTRSYKSARATKSSPTTARKSKSTPRAKTYARSTARSTPARTPATAPNHKTVYAELLEAKRAAAAPGLVADAAHAPGHRKLPIAGVKKMRNKNWANASLVNNNAADDRIARNESAQRQLLPSSTASKARRGNY